MTSSSAFLAGAKALALLGARAAGIMPAITRVEITYELQSPLSDEQLRSLGSFANTYGLRRFRVEDNNRLSFEYDASRLRETEVARVLRHLNIPVTQKVNYREKISRTVLEEDSQHSSPPTDTVERTHSPAPPTI